MYIYIHINLRCHAIDLSGDIELIQLGIGKHGCSTW